MNPGSCRYTFFREGRQYAIERYSKVEEHKLRKEESKRKFYKWEVQKCKEWLEEKFSGSIELNEWTKKLDNEVKEAEKLDREIEEARKVLETTERKYKELKATKAWKLSEEEKLKLKGNGNQKEPTEGTKSRIIQAAQEAKDTKREFQNASTNFRKKLTEDWPSRIDKEHNFHKITQDQYYAFKRVNDPLDGGSMEKLDDAQKQYNEFLQRFWEELDTRLDEAMNVRKLEEKMKAAQTLYEQAQSGVDFEDEGRISQKLREMTFTRRSYEKKRKLRRYYFQFLHPESSERAGNRSQSWWKDRTIYNNDSYWRDRTNYNEDDMKLIREFHIFKKKKKAVELEIKRVKEKEEEKEKVKKAFPDVDWQEFELRLRYGKIWLKSVKRKRERIKKKIEEQLNSGRNSQLNMSIISLGARDSTGNLVAKQRTVPSMPKGRHSKPPLKPKPSLRTTTDALKAPKEPQEDQSAMTTGKTIQATAVKGSDSAERIPPSDKEHKDIEVAASKTLPVGEKQPKGEKQPESEKQPDDKKGPEREKQPDLFYDDSDDTDWEDMCWTSKTQELYKTLREVKKKQENLKPVDDKSWTNADWGTYSKHYETLEKLKESTRDTWKDENWSLYRERDKEMKKRSFKERKGEIHVEEGRVRRRLTSEVAHKYDKKIRRNLRKKLGEDGFWTYQFLGESYIHGMMDGEAMAYQNGKDQEEAIRTTVFELR
jgi:hypothetical protein